MTSSYWSLSPTLLLPPVFPPPPAAAATMCLLGEGKSLSISWMLGSDMMPGRDDKSEIVQLYNIL